MALKWVKKGAYYFLEGFKDEALAAFSTKEFYPGFKEDADYMVSERRRFLASLELSLKDLVCPIQTHQAEVFEVFDSDRGKGVFEPDETLGGVDALVTKERGLILSVFTADCIPLFFYDPRQKSIGLAHLGWRGLANGLPETVIRKMQGWFGTLTEDLRVAVGPAIRGCCYQVAEPLIRIFANFLLKREDKNYLDLVGILKVQLKGLGILEENINDPGLCTSCLSEEFFSYRKQKDEADRLISIITLK